MRLTRLLALVGLSPPQALEIGVGLLEAVDEQVDPAGAAFATDRLMVGVDGRVVIEPGLPTAACERLGRGPIRPRVARRRAHRGRRRVPGRRRPRGPRDCPAPRLAPRRGRELPVADVAAVLQQLDEASAPSIGARSVRARSAGAAVAESSGSGVLGGAARSAGATELCRESRPRPDPYQPCAPGSGCGCFSVAVLVAVVALEVVLLRDDIVADVHLLLEAGRSGSTASTVPEPDGLPLVPPAPPAIGTVAGVDLRR